MTDLPYPWGVYARLQTEMLRGSRITDQSWGTEAAMNGVLASLQDNKPPTPDEIERTAASERRRERRRAYLRLVYLAGSDTSPHPEAALIARHELDIARSRVSERDWSVLCQVGSGCGYAELASVNGGTSGGWRVRVLRLRRQLAAKAA
jgi:hypothetical protein